MAQKKIVLWEVDAQADFMLPGGKLYVPGAEKIIPNIARLVKAANETGTVIVSSAAAILRMIRNFKGSLRTVSLALPAPKSSRKD